MRNIYYLCNMKLSIVVPVYQVKSTLPRCLDSIIRQSFRDWQMILVDDASTDGSAQICDKYVRQERRIQVVHLKHNTGLSTARNAGIEKAKGDYITFIDSDDYIADDTLKLLMELLNIHPDYDILEYPVYEHFGSNQRHMLHFPRREYSDMLTYWLEGVGYQHTYAWNKIYRRDLVRNLRFPAGRHFEDVYFMSQILNRCPLIATTDVVLYYYCYTPNGITQNATAQDLTDLLNAHIKVLNDIFAKISSDISLAKYNEAMSAYYASVLNIQLDVYNAGVKAVLPQDVSKQSPKNVTHEPLPFPILPYYNTWKLKLMHYLGLKRLCQLHSLFRHSR